MPDNGEVSGTMSVAGSIAVFIKRYIKNPMQIVFDCPMRVYDAG
jgi:hypothetical protein